jgi:hypothetical protein
LYDITEDGLNIKINSPKNNINMIRLVYTVFFGQMTWARLHENKYTVVFDVDKTFSTQCSNVDKTQELMDLKYINKAHGRAIADVIIRWLLTAKERVQSQVSPSGICE